MKKLIALLLALLVVFSLSVSAFAAPSENLISKERAKEIALDHAGYEKSEVRFIKAKLDRDDGRYEYEIEFRAEGNLEYDYSINAVNGKIVEKGTLCKMARGEMVRRMAENNVTNPEELKHLQLSNYAYNDTLSNENIYVYTRIDRLF